MFESATSRLRSRTQLVGNVNNKSEVDTALENTKEEMTEPKETEWTPEKCVANILRLIR